jgi:hypothetical protein
LNHLTHQVEMKAMRIPRWVWCLLGIVAAIISAPFLAGGYWILSIEAYERPRPFERKAQLEGAAVWSSGTEAQSADGDVCTLKYNLQFARTKQPREHVKAIESSTCNLSYTLYPAAWFVFGNVTYLRVGDEIYWRASQGRWHRRPIYWKNYWSLNRIDPSEGQIIYERATKDRIFYRVFQLPRKVGGKWALIEQKSSPQKHTKSPKPKT